MDIQEKVLNNKIKSSGVLRDGLSCENGTIIVPVSQENCKYKNWLLILKNSEDKSNITVSGKLSQGTVSFDIHAIAQELKCNLRYWLYIVAENGSDVLYTRLGRTKQALGVQKKPQTNKISKKQKLLKLFKSEDKSKIKIAYPDSFLWDENSLTIETGISNDDFNLQVIFSYDDDRASLIWRSKSLINCNIQRRSRDFYAVKRYPFAFSIVMAVYNTGDYLAEAIDSIVAQDIGFKNNIQLILVNDGSTDNSKNICDEYAKKYPKNITAIHQQHSGVSSARNAGKKLATGKYVNFMDSDDKIALNTLSSVKSFFDSNYERTDIVSIPLHFFGANRGANYQNSKFDEGNRIVNLWQDYMYSYIGSSASFVKNHIALAIDFDERITMSENIKFISQILLEKGTVGLVSDADYLQRKRFGRHSVDFKRFREHKTWYTNFFTDFMGELFEQSKQKYGFIPRFIQNAVFTNIAPHFRNLQIPDKLITENEKTQFVERLKNAVKNIDDDIFLQHPELYNEEKLQILQLKYKQVNPIFKYDDIDVFGENKLVFSLSQIAVMYDFIHIEDNNSLSIEGSTYVPECFAQADIKAFATIKGEYYLCEQVNRNFADDYNCVGRLKRSIEIKCNIPLRKDLSGSRLRIALTINGHLLLLKRYIFNRHTPFYGKIQNQYLYKNGYILTLNGGSLVLDVSNDRLKYEQAYISELENNVVQRDSRAVTPVTLTPERFEILKELRKFALNYKRERPIWILSDRATVADDNGLALFKYIVALKNCPADVYFTVSQDSPNYSEILKIGRVLPFGSMEHLKLQMVADVVASSQSNFRNRYPSQIVENVELGHRYYVDLLSEQKFVFLQHGVIMNDVSDSINRYKQNFDGIVTSTARECQSFFEYNYYYPKEKVWLTGIPRFDLLYNDEKHQITFCPTWRNTLVKVSVAMSGSGVSDSAFMDSEFYRFYNSLINNKRLLEAAKSNGYHFAMKMHPNLLQYDHLFASDNLTIIPSDEPYRKMYAESSIIITDYSSAAMDFAYMRKPVIYAQFDEEEFFLNSSYNRGYFDYRRDGFGPFTKTVEETVDAIINIINNKCKMSDEYAKRADAFFLKRDTDNCKRVYEHMLEL